MFFFARASRHDSFRSNKAKPEVQVFSPTFGFWIVKAFIYIDTHTYVHTYIYIYIYIYIYVCMYIYMYVCMCGGVGVGVYVCI